MFPVEPRAGEFDDRGLFPCQNPVLRSKVMPLFKFNPRAAEERPIGQATTFRIDPWARCVTAFHVVAGLFRADQANESALVLRDDVRLAALQIDGLGYGLNPLPPDAWRPIIEAYSLFGIESLPFQPARIRNATELMVLRIRQSGAQVLGTPYLPLDLTRWRPRVGGRVLALGFADLDLDSDDRGDNRPMSQYLYGSLAAIVDVERADGARGRPWPQFRVEADWPGGMSGGPVFNELGHVVGVVSAAVPGQGVASATYFSGWDIPERIFGSIDPCNPGWFRCYGVFNGDGALAKCGQDRATLEAFARDNGLSEVGAISLNIETGDHIRI